MISTTVPEAIRSEPWCRSVRPFACLITILVAGALPACDSAPPPPPPVESAALHTLDEFAENVASGIAMELPTHPLVAVRKTSVLGLGPIKVSGFQDQGQFDACVASVRSKLTRNSGITSRFKVIGVSSSDADAIIKDLGGGRSDTFVEPDGSNTRSVASVKYHPDSVFVLTGDFYSLNPSGGKQQSFSFTINVVHARTRELVYAHEFRRDVVWRQSDGRWYVKD